jgi:hypothetical protein
MVYIHLIRLSSHPSFHLGNISALLHLFPRCIPQARHYAHPNYAETNSEFVTHRPPSYIQRDLLPAHNQSCSSVRVTMLSFP